MPLNSLQIRAQFPILDQKINGRPLVYLDSAATAQKPLCVLNAMERYYREQNANAKRGMHALAERATVVQEECRATVQKFVNAKSPNEIVFTRNCTEGINLVARTWGDANVKKGDVLLLSLLEHHSNIVPWMQLAERTGATIEWIGLTKEGSLDMEDAEKKIQALDVKLLAVTGMSNVLGVMPDMRKLTEMTHTKNAKILVDAAQLIAHAPVDVQEIDCDFLVFSGHKIYGPMGIGILYGKEELLKQMPPFLGGGGMIGNVTKENFSVADLPEKFEAGTQSIAEMKGLQAAIRFVEGIGWENIQAHEKQLITHALHTMAKIRGVTILGSGDPECVAGCFSFTVEGVHPHDLTDWLGRQGICLRAGHHCAAPLHEELGIPASIRMAMSIMNTVEDIDAAADAITQIQKT